ncbi:hypothetical protein [Kribbella sp. CCNWLW197]|uniref:hypothetical protein n=1 Tax=Kribbella sp. CCNWLW197 TaxID=3127474 RepID=UPI003077856E
MSVPVQQADDVAAQTVAFGQAQLDRGGPAGTVFVDERTSQLTPNRWADPGGSRDRGEGRPTNLVEPRSMLKALQMNEEWNLHTMN